MISRGDSGLIAPRSTPVRVSQTSVTFHWNGPGMGRARNHDQCGQWVRGIQAFHMGPERRWNDIAYNYLACEHDVFEGRGRNIYNAGNGTTEGNRTSHAVMVLVGQGDELTEGHRDSMREIAAHLGGDIYAHRDWTTTACPGDELTEFVRDRLAGDPRPDPPPPGPHVPEFLGGPYGRNCRLFTCEGQGVKVVQHRLTQLGHVLAVDGSFGPLTEREVKRHQTAEGIVSDGIVGSVTWLHMWT